MKNGILAVASSGGHWQQLLILSEAFEDMSPVFVTTKHELLRQAAKAKGFVVDDCNRNQPMRLVKCVLQCAQIVLSLRPKIILSTGAAPGLICIAFGKLIGANTIWVDSFANVEQLSMSGKLARFLCDRRITQWEHLSGVSGPSFHGALL